MALRIIILRGYNCKDHKFSREVRFACASVSHGTKSINYNYINSCSPTENYLSCQVTLQLHELHSLANDLRNAVVDHGT